MLLVGTKVFCNGKWDYIPDPDDNYYYDEAEYHRQQKQSSKDDPPVYVCYDGRYKMSYTYDDLFFVCDENKYLTDYIFENLKGEIPEDLLGEFLQNGKVIRCPHCKEYILGGLWEEC